MTKYNIDKINHLLINHLEGISPILNLSDSGEYIISYQKKKDLEKTQSLSIEIQVKDSNHFKEPFKLSFEYKKDKKRIEKVKGEIDGSMSYLIGFIFLSELEKLAVNMGCNELRTKPKSKQDIYFWQNSDWISYSDKTYRKHLMPIVN